MKREVLVFINEGPIDSSSVRETIESLEDSSGEVYICESFSEGIEKLKKLVGNGRPPRLIAIGPDIKTPAATARQVHQILPQAQIVFLVDDQRRDELQNSLKFSTVPATHWTFGSTQNTESLLKTIHNALRVAVQRQQLRTTLDRINLKLTEPPAADSADIRKLVISDRYLASILTQVQDAIISTDLQGKIISVNHAAVNSFGYPERELIGEPVEKLVAAAEQNALRELVRRGQIQAAERKEFSARRADGTSFDVELSIAAVKDEAGKQRLGLVIIAHDITEHKRREQRLAELLESEQQAREQVEETSRLKDEFLATVSHELRTPINAILGWSTMLVSGKLASEAQARAITIIERNARIQTQLIEDLLDVSRIITGKLRLNIELVEPAGFIDAALEAVRPGAESKEIQLQKNFEENVPPVAGDSARLQQIVWNLLSNAVKFTPRGGRIEVSLRRVGFHIEISVSDSGEGIDPDFLPFVFDRFRQADASSTRRHGGLGLGLAIVRHLVELHGGTVQAFSEGAGKGATFTICLPLNPVQQADPDTGETLFSSNIQDLDTEPAERLDRIKILVVTDGPDTTESLKAVLERAGAAVETAASSDEALKVLRQHLPDVMIVDLRMPADDAFTLVKKMRALPAEQGGKIPAVALTAHARTEDRVRALLEGFQMNVARPIEKSELLVVVKSLVERNSQD